MWWWSSLEAAERWANAANIGLVTALAVGVVATYLIVSTTNVKERHWAEDREKSAKEIAALNNQTEHLRADNLALQTVMLPRHVGVIGLNERPRAEIWFADTERYPATKLVIQVSPGDSEALNLANEIALAVSRRSGWQPELIDERRSNVSIAGSEGVTVYSPMPLMALAQIDPQRPQYERLASAAHALAHALTLAALGVGGAPIQAAMLPEYPQQQPGIPWFDPPLDAVYLQVGSRPITRTLEWIRQGRPDIFGNPAK